MNKNMKEMRKLDLDFASLFQIIQSVYIAFIKETHLNYPLFHYKNPIILVNDEIHVHSYTHLRK